MATQAMHIPALATLTDQLRIVHVMDIDAGLAAIVGSTLGARASATVEELLDDPAVEVVGVCSPDRFHAEHVIAACRAGKRAVLCEKPLAITREQAQAIRDTSVSSGVPVVLGTMHAYDPGFVAGIRAWEQTLDAAQVVRSVCWLPSVARQVDWSTEHRRFSDFSFEGNRSRMEAERQRALMRSTVLDLAIHNIPLIRRVLSGTAEVRFARVRLPFGYMLSMSADDRLVQMLAMMWGRWRPEWTFDVWGAEHALHVEFPPSYVLAGSATAELRSPHGHTAFRFSRNGYQAEWEYVANIAETGADEVQMLESEQDLEFALAIAEAAEVQVLGAAL
jgi:predicted dehydrogenase